MGCDPARHLQVLRLHSNMVRDVSGRSLLGDTKNLSKLFTCRNVKSSVISEASVQSRWMGHVLQKTPFLLPDSELEVSKDVGATELSLCLVMSQ